MHHARWFSSNRRASDSSEPARSHDRLDEPGAVRHASENAVNSYNEWDPLEEAVVGIVDGAAIPSWHATLEATLPAREREFFCRFGGNPFPQELVNAAASELEGFVRVLEREGVTVRRPDVTDYSRGYATPDWEVPGGLYAAMPRDVLLVIGQEIIESPMSWRSRYFEVHAYRRLIKEYFARGARWAAAPRPQLPDDLYDSNYGASGDSGRRYVVTESEPVFDAADVIRCGRDIFVQRSHVTNRFGIRWLQQHLGDTYRVHEVEFDDKHAMHIDATLMPLAPGKLLVNPERVRRVPGPFDGWDVRFAPPPSIPDSHPLFMSSKWISMNVLMLDERRVIVESQEESLAGMLRAWGFEVITCSFRHFNAFGGSFHCAALDIRRRGGLQSYF